MKFTKMQGIGNDYVYVNCFEETVEDPSWAARFVSDRHFGIGSDGLILICPSEKADFEMRMYNADGSRGEMCGNGIRCVGKYVYDKGLTDKRSITVETLAGVKSLDLTVENGQVSEVTVDMGQPGILADRLPVILGKGEVPADPEGRLIRQPIQVQGKTYYFTAVSMGNPHIVLYVDDPYAIDLEAVGPSFENHSYFPERTNTEFVRVLDRNHVEIRVWERGAGETWACGTGACAVAVSSAMNGLTGREVTVKLRGGDLEINWDEKTDHVFMTGPAVTVFEGEIDLR